MLVRPRVPACLRVDSSVRPTVTDPSHPYHRASISGTPQPPAHMQHDPPASTVPPPRIVQSHPLPKPRPQALSLVRSLVHVDHAPRDHRQESAHISVPVHTQVTSLTAGAASEPGSGIHFGIPRVQSAPQNVSTARKQTLRLQQPSHSLRLCAMWRDLLSRFGQASQLVVSMQHSMHVDAHLDRVLDQFAPSTIWKYVATVRQFMSTCNDSGIDPVSITPVQLADLLMTASLAKSTDGGSSHQTTIKALRRCAKMAQITTWDFFYDPIVDSFLKQKRLIDRKEAPPLPLWTIVQFERRVLMSSCPESQVIILGSFLLMCWTSMRFADMQRVSLKSFGYDPHSLRGTCWRSKTTARGQPFGLVSSGLMSEGSFTWVLKFLWAMDQILTRLHLDDLDFVLPAFRDDLLVVPLEPMSYASALQHLRKFIHAPWRTLDSPIKHLSLNYSLHSLKVTFLSWSNQLAEKILPELRMLQGHHRSSAHQSMRLYSRDDVLGALRCQTILRNELLRGWRPMIPLHRGGQLPMVEPAVQIELFRKQADDLSLTWFACQDHTPLPAPEPQTNELGDSSDSSASSDSESSTASADPAPPTRAPPQHTAGASDEILLACHRQKCHMLIACPDTTIEFVWYAGSHYKPACGVRMSNFSVTIHESYDPQMLPCQHAGCKKAFLTSGHLQGP